MTGFASSAATHKEGKITIEARSENHRFLDVKFQIPEQLNSLEVEFMEISKKQISRGKVKLSINIEDNSSRIIKFNNEAGKNYLASLKKFIRELGIKDDISLSHILMFKELYNGETKKTISKTTLGNIKKVLNDTLKKLDKSRAVEGKKLSADLLKRINNCKKLITSIRKKRNNFAKEASKKLKERIETLLDDKNIDEARLYQEVAILAERSDITEELVRLDAHFEKFIETTNSKLPVGKELDFLIQEMNRESGTISAKSKDANISHHIISLRSELEKMREQIQNIE
jgi:uncharacterized protein (TIGR00255 family)